MPIVALRIKLGQAAAQEVLFGMTERQRVKFSVVITVYTKNPDLIYFQFKQSQL